jgi:hypothetical protein
MAVLDLLVEYAETAALRDDEQTEIAGTAATLTASISEHFGRKVSSVMRFGSTRRDTCLPRAVDEMVDVDLLVAFAGLSPTPQEYLGELRRFADAHYSDATISRAVPGVALELGRFVFDLVPATISPAGKFRIADSSNEWFSLDPRVFNAQLMARDAEMGGLLKPTIRLMKLWNVTSDRPFASFELEQWLCRLNFKPRNNLLGHLFNAIDRLSLGYWQNSRSAEDELRRARVIAQRVIEYQVRRDEARAEQEITRLFNHDGEPMPPAGAKSEIDQYFHTLKQNWLKSY